MTECAKCVPRRAELTNQLIRRSEEACAREYFLDPAVQPLLDIAAFPDLEYLCRTKGILVAQDPATGFVRPPWLYADPALFAAEFIGVLDWALECGQADCRPFPRKCDGKVVVYSGCVVAEYHLATPAVLATGQSIIPVLGPLSYVLPDTVDVAPAGDPLEIGTVDCGYPGVTASTVIATGMGG